MIIRCILAVFLYALCLRIQLGRAEADLPCAARPIPGQSVVCVCNTTYCDDVTRETPADGGYVVYTSSKAGLRFRKSIGTMKAATTRKCCSTTFTIDPEVEYQTIQGFGGAVTDSAGINWGNLTEILQKYLINSYFGDNGLQYNMVRVPIGGCDFSTHPWAYNELPVNDTHLTNFTLSYEDTEFKLPMLRDILAASSRPVHVLATTWSPPPWMKRPSSFTGRSFLREEYFQTYVDYHLKFIEKYTEAGVPIWGITTTNEPADGVIPLSNFNSLGWLPSQMGKWIVNNLGPTIRNSRFRNLTILTMDDQRFMIPIWLDVMIRKYPRVLDYIDGVAVHYYADFAIPASYLATVPRNYPGKYVIATEASVGCFPWQTKVVIGSWTRAETYLYDIMVDLNNDVTGWIDWNLCLNAEGGPNWVKNFVDSPIIVYPEKDEFVKQPMFYALGHFAKFVPQGSKRIKVTEKKSFFAKSVEHVAFVTPSGNIVLVLYNGSSKRTVAVRLGNRQTKLKLDSNSITTIEFAY